MESMRKRTIRARGQPYARLLRKRSAAASVLQFLAKTEENSDLPPIDTMPAKPQQKTIFAFEKPAAS